MIEKTVLDYMNSKLQVKAYMERPEKPEQSYVLIEVTSAGDEEHIKNVTIAIQSYATSLYKAADLNDSVVKAMEDIDTLTNISRCSLNTFYNFTNTTTKEYRYQAVFDLVYMEE
ncbi:MAG: hypothetical protein LKE48_03225 [Solobacterium sp.]|jgi:hypothetical protein|nr:hypothetical protein [Solobacterium sp.]MCH4281516.1 hypothetical protein [Solobacterium sp.]